jgi:UDP-3-O-[3-hydroxymyristoyl] glucosamine N-acyltransferase
MVFGAISIFGKKMFVIGFTSFTLIVNFRLLTIEDDVVINGDINIHGVCTIKKSAIILDNVSIRGNIIIGANCLICGDVKLTGKTIVSDGLNMTGNETYHNKKLTDIMF